MAMILRWMPAIVILGLMALHVFQSGSQPQSPKAPIGQGEIGDAVTVVPGSVHDGDTLQVRRGTETIKVRFCGIDAPELAQPLGQAAREHLVALVGDGRVRLVEVERDKYGRMVGELFLLDGRSVNVEMVRAGMAYHYGRYSGGCSVGGAMVSDRPKVYGQAENEAKIGRIGVWAGDYQKPWDYRRSQ